MNDSEMGKLMISLSWDDVIFVSKWHREETLNLNIPLKKTDIIYNGVTVDFFQREKGNGEKTRQQIRSGPEEKILFWPSRIVNPDGRSTTRKRLDTLLKAGARIKEKTKLKDIIATINSLGTFDVMFVEGADEPWIPKIMVGNFKEREKTIYQYKGNFKEIYSMIRNKINEDKHSIKNKKVIVKVNGKLVPLTAFPSTFIENTVVGMLQSLKGVNEIKEVELRFKR